MQKGIAVLTLTGILEAVEKTLPLLLILCHVGFNLAVGICRIYTAKRKKCTMFYQTFIRFSILQWLAHQPGKGMNGSYVTREWTVNIALVDDDPIQCNLLSSWLESAGHQCSCFANGKNFTRSLEHNQYHLLLLDWELPDFSGLEILKWLRQEIGHSLPVMFITGRDEETDIVQALKTGADDYLIKPIRRQELLARIEALLRRSTLYNPTEGVRTVGPFSIDQQSRQLRKNGCAIELTQKEFGLATHLLSNVGKLISRDELLEEVWGHATSLNTRTVDTHVSRIRKKLELVPESGWNLSAIYQHGYRLDWLGVD